MILADEMKSIMIPCFQFMFIRWTKNMCHWIE